VIPLKTTTLFILLVVVISTVCIVGCTQQPPVQPTPQPTTLKPNDTVRVATTTLGNILADAQGKTLYYFAKDIAGSGASSCSGQCAVVWPVFSADPVTVSSPLVSSDFASIIRADGTKQTTFRGWPLYYFQADVKAGDVLGENVTGNWFVVKPDETVMLSQQGSRLFLTDKTGKTLYYFTKDTSGTSTCTAACLANWPVFSADPLSAPSVLKAADFSIVTRTDGAKQTAYLGRPLYYFTADTKPGDMKGDGVNSVWFVANASGSVPVVATTQPTTTATTQRSSYGGY